jgi:hypothetical protein
MGFDEPHAYPEKVLLPNWARQNLQGKKKGDRVK